MLAALGSDTAAAPPARLAARPDGATRHRREHADFADLDSGILQRQRRAAQRLSGEVRHHIDSGSGPSLTSRLIFGADTPLAFAGGLCEIT
jgi:hypothetical protein